MSQGGLLILLPKVGWEEGVACSLHESGRGWREAKYQNSFLQKFLPPVSESFSWLPCPLAWPRLWRQRWREQAWVPVSAPLWKPSLGSQVHHWEVVVLQARDTANLILTYDQLVYPHREECATSKTPCELDTMAPGTCLQSQHSGGRSRRTNANLWPAWSTQQVPGQLKGHSKTLCQKPAHQADKQTKTKLKPSKQTPSVRQSSWGGRVTGCYGIRNVEGRRNRTESTSLSGTEGKLQIPSQSI